MSAFQTMVDNLYTNETKGFQWGGQNAPMHPAVYQATLMGFAAAENINWPGQDMPTDETQAADNSVLKYAVFYQHLLAKVQYEAEPMNAPQPFADWWTAAKKVTG